MAEQPRVSASEGTPLTEHEISRFLQDLIGYGLAVRLSDDGENLVVDKTYGTLTEKQRERLRVHKPEIMAYLRAKDFDPKVAQQIILTMYDSMQAMLDKHIAEQMRAEVAARWGVTADHITMRTVPRDKVWDMASVQLSDQIAQVIVARMQEHLTPLWEALNAKDLRAIRMNVCQIEQTLARVLVEHAEMRCAHGTASGVTGA